MDTSYLSQQVTTIINQLHGYFDEIGVPSHERDSRESEVRTLFCCAYGSGLTILSCSLRCRKHSTISSNLLRRMYPDSATARLR